MNRLVLTRTEDDDQNQHDERNIDGAEIWQPLADRLQQRLGDAVEEIVNDRHRLVAGTDHVEHDQPAQDRCRDEDVHVKFEKQVDEPRTHVEHRGERIWRY
jgi:hypothetical protein